MSISALKTWIAEILTPNDLNGEFTNNREYIKENRDMVLGNNAEGTGFSGHNHNGTLGVQLAAAGLASDSVITDKVLNANITAEKLAADAVNQQRAVLTQRFKNCELVYEDTDNVTVSFPWTEIGGTAWSNVTGIDVSAVVASGGNVKAGVEPNTASAWYYLYVSNTFTVGQPLVAEFLLTKSATGETGYTLIGAIYNAAGQEIEPFDQFGRQVMWREPIKVLDGGASTEAWGHDDADIDCSSSIPAISVIGKFSGYILATTSATSVGFYLRIAKNGCAPSESPAHGNSLAGMSGVLTNTSGYTVFGTRDLQLDGSQEIEYKIAVSNATALATIYTLGYYVR